MVKRYPDKAYRTAFLLGGIGTGNFSVGSRGQLTDFELFNRPGKGARSSFTFFAIRAKAGDAPAVTKVLEARLPEYLSDPFGMPTRDFGGLPRLDSSVLSAEYPFVNVEFADSNLPVDVKLEAFTPFIPLNARDSGIPAAIMRYSVTNTSEQPADVSVAASFQNMAGYEGLIFGNSLKLNFKAESEKAAHGRLKGFVFTNKNSGYEIPRENSMSLSTTADDVTYKQNWLPGWADGLRDFWDDFSDDGRLAEPEPIRNARIPFAAVKVSSIAASRILAPGEVYAFEFVVSWYFPNRPKAWACAECECEAWEKNYYATVFGSAWVNVTLDNMADYDF